MKSLHVRNGKSLGALIKIFPGCTVHTLEADAGEDAWRVDVMEEADIRGPLRVVVEVQAGTVAYAVGPLQAADEFGIIPDIILVRNDGWTLGAKKEDREAAVKAWEGDWVAEVNVATSQVTLLGPAKKKKKKSPKPIRTTRKK